MALAAASLEQRCALPPVQTTANTTQALVDAKLDKRRRVRAHTSGFDTAIFSIISHMRLMADYWLKWLYQNQWPPTAAEPRPAGFEEVFVG